MIFWYQLSRKKKNFFLYTQERVFHFFEFIKFKVIFSLRRRAFGFFTNCKNKPKDIWRFMKCKLYLFATLHLPVWWSVMQRKNICLHQYWAERRKNFEKFVSSKYCRGRVTSEQLSSVPNKHTRPNKCRAF